MSDDKMSARITGEDTFLAAAVKLSEGNPGALRVLCELFKASPIVDPQSLAGTGWGPILSLDTLGIYGSRIWLLYKDVCGEDITRMLTILRAEQLGLIAMNDLVTAVEFVESPDRAHYGFLDDPEGLLEQVRKELPGFARDTPEVERQPPPPAAQPEPPEVE